MKANPIHLINVKRKDVFRIYLTDILRMRIKRNQSQIASDLGFAYCPVLLRESNMHDVPCGEQSAKLRNVWCGGGCHVSIVTCVGGECKKKERFI